MNRYTACFSLLPPLFLLSIQFGFGQFVYGCMRNNNDDDFTDSKYDDTAYDPRQHVTEKRVQPLEMFMGKGAATNANNDADDDVQVDSEDMNDWSDYDYL